MTYFMPTRIFHEDDVVSNHSELFGSFGKKALIVTGRHSAKLNGAMDDVLKALKINGVDHALFSEVTENPPIEQVIEGVKYGNGCDFVIGIGGGSPIDAAKGIALLLNNPEVDPFVLLYETKESEGLPLIAIPTTAGTGTETTPFAVFTDHKLMTKTSMTQRLFPRVALHDVKYYLHMPKKIRNSTCVDALTHSIESYMNTNATIYSEYIALESIRIWGEHKRALMEEDMSKEVMNGFIQAATLGGMAIAQTGTSIPHSMGYPLTYHHGLAHGNANGVFMASYLNLCRNKWKVANIMDHLGFASLKEFDGYLKRTIGWLTITDEEIDLYANQLMSNTRKLGNHPDPITKEDIVRLYQAAVGGKHDQF